MFLLRLLSKSVALCVLRLCFLQSRYAQRTSFVVTGMLALYCLLSADWAHSSVRVVLVVVVLVAVAEALDPCVVGRVLRNIAPSRRGADDLGRSTPKLPADLPAYAGGFRCRPLVTNNRHGRNQIISTVTTSLKAVKIWLDQLLEGEHSASCSVRFFAYFNHPPACFPSPSSASNASPKAVRLICLRSYES